MKPQRIRCLEMATQKTDSYYFFPMHSVLGGALFRLRLGLTASSHDTIGGIPIAYCGFLCAQSLRDVFQFLPGKEGGSCNIKEKHQGLHPE